MKNHPQQSLDRFEKRSFDGGQRVGTFRFLGGNRVLLYVRRVPGSDPQFASIVTGVEVSILLRRFTTAASNDLDWQ